MQARGHGRPDRVGVGCAWGLKLETGETHRSIWLTNVFITPHETSNRAF